MKWVKNRDIEEVHNIRKKDKEGETENGRKLKKKNITGDAACAVIVDSLIEEEAQTAPAKQEA